MLGSSRGLGHRPFTAGTRVRISYRVPFVVSFWKNPVSTWIMHSQCPLCLASIGNTVVPNRKQGKHRPVSLYKVWALKANGSRVITIHNETIQQMVQVSRLSSGDVISPYF